MNSHHFAGKVATNRIELTGQRFERLLVTKPIRITDVEALHYECLCDCGNVVIVRAQNLRKGLTRSCGCLRKETSKKVNLQHGMSHTSIHNVWMGMLGRCENPTNQAYKDYGGRGIKVCERWHSFENFLEDVGLPPQTGLSLDRFPNNDGDYEPGNVRWATKKEQANNRRSSKLLTFEGQTMTYAQWEDYLGLRRGEVWSRIDKGWVLQRVLSKAS